LLAGIIAFVDFLPVLGAGGVLIPWALIAFILGNVKLAIGLLVLYVVILMVRNLVEPHVLGQQIGMHPLLTLFSIYLGFRMYGFLGMLIVPLLFITVIQLNQWGYIRLWRDKNTDSEEEALPPDSD
jgi:predicted PurR-regulated permease PerM